MQFTYKASVTSVHAEANADWLMSVFVNEPASTHTQSARSVRAASPNNFGKYFHAHQAPSKSFKHIWQYLAKGFIICYSLNKSYIKIFWPMLIGWVPCYLRDTQIPQNLFQWLETKALEDFMKIQKNGIKYSYSSIPFPEVVVDIEPHMRCGALKHIHT